MIFEALKNDELIKLIKIKKLELDELFLELATRKITFDSWVLYGEKIHYDNLIGVNYKTRQFLNKHMQWIFKEKGFLITLEFILDSLKVLEEEKAISSEEVIEIKEELQAIKFGSMKFTN